MNAERLQEIRDRHEATQWYGIPPVEESVEAHDDRHELLEEVDRLREENAALRRGQGRAPAPAQTGPAPAPLHETHPIPDSTKGGDA